MTLISRRGPSDFYSVVLQGDEAVRRSPRSQLRCELEAKTGGGGTKRSMGRRTRGRLGEGAAELDRKTLGLEARAQVHHRRQCKALQKAIRTRQQCWLEPQSCVMMQ
ncbi:Uncharacterized protein DAT39_008933 [Clarias magur]|uniref:Uncharacterized protein n=1 Tax=Clarias magur TaxID=1594786 RepID=A0A8J4TT40_CLAMG|nr:Uncharacterized protein DAT39_008933 [Clarias magur]